MARKAMTKAERAQVSQRMTAYWAAKRRKAKPSRRHGSALRARAATAAVITKTASRVGVAGLSVQFPSSVMIRSDAALQAMFDFAAAAGLAVTLMEVK